MAGFDATLGGSAATSYITDAEADALLVNTQFNSQWQGNTTAEKQQHLVAATFWLDQVDYAGTRCNPRLDAQKKTPLRGPDVLFGLYFFAP